MWIKWYGYVMLFDVETKSKKKKQSINWYLTANIEIKLRRENAMVSVNRGKNMWYIDDVYFFVGMCKRLFGFSIVITILPHFYITPTLHITTNPPPLLCSQITQKSEREDQKHTQLPTHRLNSMNKYGIESTRLLSAEKTTPRLYCTQHCCLHKILLKLR